MTINMGDLVSSLHIMWKGMLGLFASCGFIMLLIMLLSALIRKRSKP